MATNEEWVRQQLEAQEQEEQRQLVEALVQASESGKEPFDLDAFELLYDTSTSLGYLPPRDVRLSRWKLKYYVSHPEFGTLAQFAAYLEKMDPWR